MAGLGRRLDEAAAALVTLEEVAEKADRMLVERDGAILRLIYTFGRSGKLASSFSLSARASRSRLRTQPSARRGGLAGYRTRTRAAIRLGHDRNLAVHMYRGDIGAEIAQRLASHAALLRRWLDALRARFAA
ncbi:MAG: hypothetical protein WB611_30900 [Stellaceae bacterium]